MHALRRPLPVALAIALFAQLLFGWRLATPHKPYFDEVHYLPAARTLWALTGPTNIEHPLVGKLLIGLGIAIFGDDPLGWRIFSAMAATATLLGMFAILQLLFGRLRTSVLGTLLALGNFTLFIQARIAMLDGFMAAFIVGAVATMLWAMRGQGPSVQRRWVAGSVLLGLAVGTKWTAVPYLAFAGVAFLLVKRRHPKAWPGLTAIPALAILGGVSVLTYLATFAPAFFYGRDPLTLARLLPFQLEMYRQQTQVLSPHTYQSDWWTWAIDRRPIWYLYEAVDGAQRGVLMLGNPAVFWGGLVAVVVCLWGWARDRDAKLGAVAGLWFASYAMWAVIPKSLGFIYYYYLSSLWLPIVIAAAFHRYAHGSRKHWDEWFLVLNAGLFAYFYPIISSAALSGPGAFQHWMWFGSWA